VCILYFSTDAYIGPGSGVQVPLPGLKRPEHEVDQKAKYHSPVVFVYKFLRNAVLLMLLGTPKVWNTVEFGCQKGQMFRSLNCRVSKLTTTV
jgi:hypothetical protein